MQPVTRFLARHFDTQDRRRIAERLRSVLREAGVEPKRRRLYSLIDEGNCDEALAGRITDALGETDGAAFREALERSRMPRADLASVFGAREADDPRLSGEPHLWILHERRKPQPLFPVALTGIKRWKVLDLPEDIESCSAEQRRRLIRQRVLDHQQAEGGRSGLFGRVTGYLYCPDPEHSYKITTSGRIESLNCGPFSEFIPKVWIGMKK